MSWVRLIPIFVFLSLDAAIEDGDLIVILTIWPRKASDFYFVLIFHYFGAPLHVFIATQKRKVISVHNTSNSTTRMEECAG